MESKTTLSTTPKRDERPEKKGNGIGHISFSKVNLPSATESINTRGAYINCGKDNDFPQIMNGLRYDNPVHGGIIEQKINFMTSGGIEVIGDDSEALLNNYDGELTLEELNESLCDDQEMHNGMYILFTKGESGKYYAEQLPYAQVRVGLTDDYYIYSANFKDNKEEQIAYLDIDGDINELPKGMEVVADSYIVRMFVQPQQRTDEKKFSTSVYPVPNYSGAISAIMASVNMDYFTLSETKNGFKGGTHVAFHNGIPDTPEEELLIMTRVTGSITNEDKGGGITYTWDNGGDSATTINPMNGNDLDKRYESAKKLCRESIMIAHQVISPALFGIADSSMFGSKEEMEVAYVLFQQNYVRKRNRLRLGALLYGFQKLNGFQGEINAIEPALSLDQATEEENETVRVINSMSPLLAQKFLDSLTDNEVRELGGKVAIVGGDVIKTDSGMFSAQTKEESLILEHFSRVGKPADKIKKRQFADVVLTENQRIVLTMIKDGESFESIVKATELSSKRVAGIILSLGELKLLDGFELTDKGIDVSLTENEIEVVYSYEEKYNAPPLVEGGKSRTFCATLMGMKKVYTREEIDAISSSVCRDVWLYRGGWYHNPDKKVNTPSCRHEWKQHVIFK